MRILLIAFVFIIACDVFRAGQPRSRLTPEQFAQVYVELAKAHTPAAKQVILKKHKTTEKDLQDFIRAYTKDLPELSAAFDSALARLATPEAQ